nr:MAG TPA: hypothetical protein [Caudoviricetes sp.]
MKKYRIVHVEWRFFKPKRTRWQVCLIPSVFVTRADIASVQPYIGVSVLFLLWGIEFSVAFEKK